MLCDACFVCMLNITNCLFYPPSIPTNASMKKPEVLVKTTSRRIGSSDDEDEAFLRHSGPGSGPVSPNSAFTRPYTYESNVDDHSRRKFEPQGVGFRYDAHNAGHSQQPKSPNGNFFFDFS